MTMIESDDDQKKGIVFVYFGALPSQPNQHSGNNGLLWNLPIFCAGIHLCFNELAAYLLFSVAVLRLPLNLRPQSWVHYGSCTDCLRELSSFGIARESIVTDCNEPRLDDHSAWYRRRQELELKFVTDGDAETQSVALAADGGIVPGPKDVLFGCGSRKNQNGGNILMKTLVVAMLDEHKESRKGRKVELTESVVVEIKKKGGRFLKQNEETKNWEEVSHMEACSKVSHAFRNIRRPSRAKKKA